MSRPIAFWPTVACLLVIGGAGGSAFGGPPEIPSLPPRSNPAALNRVVPAASRVGQPAPKPNAKQPPAANTLPPPKVLPPGAVANGKPADGVVTPIDLANALRLAGVDNPEIIIARDRVLYALAVRQQAAAVILPSLNAGLNYDAHTGPLMQSSGNILKVNRSSLYVGAGANAVAAGTVSIPGVSYNFNLSEAIFKVLITRQGVARARYANLAVRNQVFRRVAVAYSELLRAEGRQSIAKQVEREAGEVLRLSQTFTKAGAVAQADADRAATEEDLRLADLAEADAEVQIASARLAALLGLDRAVQLHGVEDRVVPQSIVPDNIPLVQLIAIAMLQRPELAEQQAAIRQAMLALNGAKLLPFSPQLIVGFSAGGFGGGSGGVASSLAPQTFRIPPQPRFGNFGDRNDLDAIMYWTIQNLGIGNLALIRAARSGLTIQQLERLKVLNQVRREVADAYVRTQVRLAEVATAERAVLSSTDAFHEDFRRILGGQARAAKQRLGRPIELLQSLELLAKARYAYLNAIVTYNEAQIDLYVALGQPPADTLARPIPTNFSAPLPKVQKR